MKPSFIQNLTRRSPLAGFTMIEVMVAMVAAGILIAAVVSLSMFTTRTFYMTGNYVDMDAKSRNTIDVISRYIRDSTGLIAVGTGSSPYLLFTNTTATATADKSTKISYDSSARTLSITQNQQSPKVFLTECDKWNYSLYKRNAIITSTNISFYSTTNLAEVKLVNLNWTCSRQILGSKLNTETVLTAQVVLRNKLVE